MKLNDEEFESYIDNGKFCICITQETDFTWDGGLSYEESPNTFGLNKKTAKELLLELQEYLKET